VPISPIAVTHENHVAFVCGGETKLSLSTCHHVGRTCAWMNKTALTKPAKIAASGARAEPRKVIATAIATSTNCSPPAIITSVGEAFMPRRR